MSQTPVKSAAPTGVTRRRLLKTGAVAAGTAGIGGFPFINSRTARAQGEPLKFWQFYAPGGEVAPQVAWFEKLVADWNASHDVQVALQYVVGTEYMNGTTLATAFASGEGPDIFIISPGDFLRYYNGGVLQDLTPHLTPEAQADFPESVIANRMVDGKIFGIPMEVEPMAFYYSVQAFEEAGLNETDVPTTWEGLLDLAGRLTTDERYGVLFETGPGYYQNFTWYPFMWQGDGEIQGADGRSAFNSPGTIQALKLWQDAINSGVAPRQTLGNGGPDIAANLGSGYCAMQNVGIWGISAMDNNAPDVPYGVFKLPVPAGGKYVTVGGGWAFVANSQGPDPESAAEFCTWSLASMEPDSIERVVTWCTEAKSDMPPRDSALEAGRAAFEKGHLATFANEIHPGTRAEPRVPPEVYKIVSDAIQATQLGGAEPEQAAASASDQLDAFLASYEGAPIL